jgi:threonine synthase
VWLKYEGLNPTGSFKDRGMTVAVSKALEEGSRAIACASTGNTSASAAAYAARAKIECVVLVPEGKVALGKLAQTMVHGAHALEIEGNFDEALALMRTIAAERPLALVNSVNPHRIEGQKTAAFEIVDALGDAPDLNLIPVGNAGNITAYWRGYVQALSAGMSTRLPKMYGFQARGADPIVRGKIVANPQTAATAIRIGNPASWAGAEAAAAESKGGVLSVTDASLRECYRLLAEEGVFVELASAASIAGLRKLKELDLVPPNATIACVLTGHGLKDPDVALDAVARPARVRAAPGPIIDALKLS